MCAPSTTSVPRTSPAAPTRAADRARPGQRALRLDQHGTDLVNGRALGHSLMHAVLMWFAYVALEPYVRRLWPRLHQRGELHKRHLPVPEWWEDLPRRRDRVLPPRPDVLCWRLL